MERRVKVLPWGDMKYTALFVGLCVSLFFLILHSQVVRAQISDESVSGLEKQVIDAQQKAGYDIDSGKSVQTAVGRVINYVAGLIGTLLLVLIVYGAYEWMTAAGNDDQISKAKDTIKRAIIGVAILLAAFAITKLVVTTVIYSTQKSIMSQKEYDEAAENSPNVFNSIGDGASWVWGLF